jgi:hypothetical protein
MSRSPVLSEVIASHVRMVLESARTAIPGRVEKYDSATQTADVQPMVRNVLIDPDGNRLEESLPIIPNVPVAWPRGGGFFLSMPVEKGDFVLLVICDRCIDVWRAKGSEADPADLRHHDLSDAVAIPGLYPDTAPLNEASGTELVLGKDGGVQVRIGSLMTLATVAGAGSADFVALAQKVLTELNKLATDLNTLKTVFSTWIPVVQDGGAALKTAAAAWYGSSVSVSDVAATKVKAE